MAFDKEVEDIGNDLRNFYKELENEQKEKLKVQARVNLDLAKFFRTRGDYNQMAIFFNRALAIQQILSKFEKA